jgi:putative hemolysin
MTSTALEILIILALIALNGFLALAELAVVSSRTSRLREMADRHVRGARTALNLAEAPTDFLASVQVGITLVGILAGAFGGATLSAPLAAWMASIPVLAPYAVTIAFVTVVALISYLTLIVGELAPKRIALGNPERWAVIAAPPMHAFARVATPLVRLLGASTDAVLWVLRVKPSTRQAASDEEVKLLLEEGMAAGTFERAEIEIVKRLFRMSDRRVGDLLTPRTDVVWLDTNDPDEEVTRTVLAYDHDYFPVAAGNVDRVLGIVRSRDIVARMAAHQPVDLPTLMHTPLVIPEGQRALAALDLLRAQGEPMAVVIDEYGETEGIVTLTDILESLVGEFASPEGEPDVVRRGDGSLLLDGMLPIHELKDLLHVEELPNEEDGYRTLAGFLMAYAGRIPDTGDAVTWEQYRLTVMDMDGNRIDRVLVECTGVDTPPDQ